MVEQKDDCVSVCTDLHERAQNDPNFMSLVITGDECWVYGMTRKQRNVLPVEHSIISLTEESAADEVQCQDHVDCVLQQ